MSRMTTYRRHFLQTRPPHGPSSKIVPSQSYRRLWSRTSRYIHPGSSSSLSPRHVPQIRHSYYAKCGRLKSFLHLQFDCRAVDEGCALLNVKGSQ
jgi:hypothetical protein